MDRRRNRTRLQLLVAAAAAIGCASATLSGSLVAHARPVGVREPVVAGVARVEAAVPVRTIGMMMADHPIG